MSGRKEKYRNENLKINLFYTRHKSKKVYNSTCPCHSPWCSLTFEFLTGEISATSYRYQYRVICE